LPPRFWHSSPRRRLGIKRPTAAGSNVSIKDGLVQKAAGWRARPC
jgi:hypothetical protein